MDVFFLPWEKSLLLIILDGRLAGTKIKQILLYIMSVSLVYVFSLAVVDSIRVVLFSLSV